MVVFLYRIKFSVQPSLKKIKKGLFTPQQSEDEKKKLRTLWWPNAARKDIPIVEADAKDLRDLYKKNMIKISSSNSFVGRDKKRFKKN